VNKLESLSSDFEKEVSNAYVMSSCEYSEQKPQECAEVNI